MVEMPAFMVNAARVGSGSQPGSAGVQEWAGEAIFFPFSRHVMFHVSQYKKDPILE